MDGALPEMVSERPQKTPGRPGRHPGAGNHYLEVQVVDEIFDDTAAQV
jgi:RNA-splicing ligase RtcB